MAVTIVDTRSIWDEGDAVTDWISSTGKTELYTADPSPVELIGSIGHTVGIATHDLYATKAAVNLSDTLIYVWTINNGIMDTAQNGGIALVIGDATPDRIGFHLAGSDQAAFRYDGASVSWQCLVIDTALLPTDFSTVIAGALANLDLTNVITLGAMHKNLAKALGGVENAFVDIIRYGAGGLRITGGTTGDRGTFLEIYDDDKSDADQKAYGIMRELSTNVFGIQGTLTFGLSGAGDTWFEDQDVTIIYEDRFIGDNRYIFRVIGNISGGEETHFILSGCTIQSAAKAVLVDFSEAGIDELDIQACTFRHMLNGLYMASDSDSLNHVFSNNNIVDCGTFYPGKVPIRSCTFAEVTEVESTSGSFYWTDGGVDVQDSTFRNNQRLSPSGAAGIIHPSGGTVQYVNLRFSDNDFDIIYLGASGTTLTIEAQGTSNPTSYYAPSGGTVDIQNSKTLTLTGIVSATEVRIQVARGANPSGAELFHVENTTGADVVYSYNYAGDFDVDVIIHNVLYDYIRIDNLTLTDENASIPVQQTLDRWYSNL